VRGRGPLAHGRRRPARPAPRPPRHQGPHARRGRRRGENGRMAELLNAGAKDKLPLLVVFIDNGRAKNTFTKDVATT
jgi:hypothetical protein